MAEQAGRFGFLERRFRFAANGTTIARDTMAGVTTFIVMSYIIFVNPQILSFAGIDGLEEIGLPFNQVLAATCLVAGVMRGRNDTDDATCFPVGSHADGRLFFLATSSTMR
mgnify:CR=1 FL=1